MGKSFASYLAMLCSACLNSVFRPPGVMGRLTTVRNAAAKGTWKFGSASILSL